MENFMVPIEWKGKIVITTAQLAEVYETSPDNIKKNFNRNSDRFKEGLHYILLLGEDLRIFKDQVTESHPVAKGTSQLYLWTERGANRHCKILGTDKAWEQFDNLEETYFRTKQQAIDRAQLSPQTQLLLSMFESIARTELEQKRQSEKLNRLEDNQRALTDTFQSTPDSESFQQWANKCLSKIAESSNFHPEYGRQSRYAFARNESYDRLKRKWNCNLDDRVARAKGRAMERNPGITKAELNSINKLTIITNDKSLRPVYETVIKEMMIAYCVK